MIPISAFGRLTRDPELVQVNSSAGNVCRLAIAANTNRRDQSGQNITVFFDATVWGRTGQNCATYLHKGDSVFVSGEFLPNYYKTRNGEDKVSFRIENANVQFGPRGERNNQYEQGYQNDQNNQNDGAAEDDDDMFS